MVNLYGDAVNSHIKTDKRTNEKIKVNQINLINSSVCLNLNFTSIKF